MHMKNLIILSVGCSLLMGMAQAKTPTPSAEEQKRAEKAIRDTFRGDYQKKERADRLELAAKLLAQVSEIKADQAMIFVLLREAKDISAEALDLTGAYSIIDRMTQSFDVKADEYKTAVLALAKKAVKTPVDAGAFVESCLSAVHSLIKAGDFDGALRLAKESEQIVKLSKDAVLSGKVADAQRDIPELKKEGDLSKNAEAALAANPEDGDNNQIVGLFVCFVKDEWDRGLAFLLKASDGLLKDIAKKELEHPKDAEPMADLGDAWWFLAEKKRGLEKARYQGRAKYWYLAAVNKLSILQKGKAFERLKLLGAIPKERSIEDFVIGDFEDPADLKKWAIGAFQAPCAKSGKGALSIENFEGQRQYSFTEAVPKDITGFKYLMVDVMIPGEKTPLEIILESPDGYLSWVNTLGGDAKWVSLKLEITKATQIGKPSIKNIKSMIIKATVTKKICMYFDNIILTKESK
jgi:hypothetical protein